MKLTCPKCAINMDLEHYDYYMIKKRLDVYYCKLCDNTWLIHKLRDG